MLCNVPEQTVADRKVILCDIPGGERHRDFNFFFDVALVRVIVWMVEASWDDQTRGSVVFMDVRERVSAAAHDIVDYSFPPVAAELILHGDCLGCSAEVAPTSAQTSSNSPSSNRLAVPSIRA